jgi:uncharacterized protein YjbI with pentapeptide repeats
MKLSISMPLATILINYAANSALALNENHFKQLLETRQCNGCNLIGANLNDLDLSGVQLIDTNLNAANLANTNLQGANLTRSSLVAANLSNANLRQTNLSETAFVYANLAQANMQGSTLYCTDLQWTNLSGVDLSNAKIERTSFAHANLAEIKLPRTVKVVTDHAFDTEMDTSDGSNHIERRIITTDVNIYETGGSRSPKHRSYHVPAWIGTIQRSGCSLTRNIHSPSIQDPS